MPIYEVECPTCKSVFDIYRLKFVAGDTVIGHCATCQTTKTLEKHLVPPAIRFIDGSSQWETNSTRAERLRKGTL